MPSTRVAVIGSGVAGASTAFALAAAGADVVIVDDARRGQATAAGAGIVEPWSSSSEGSVYDLYAAAAAYYPRFVEQLAASGVADVGYRVTGSLVVSADEAQLDDVEQRLRRRTAGVPAAGAVERLDPAQARALFPPLAPELSAVHVAGGARVDGRRLRDGLLAAAQRFGAQVELGCAQLESSSAQSWTVQTPNRQFAVDAVVVACGAWTNAVLAPVHYEVPVEPQRGQLVHLLIEGTDTGPWPSVLPLSSHYIVCFDGGRIVVGATRETGSGFDPRVTAGGLREVLHNALTVAPGLAAASLHESRVGLRPRATHGAPLLGPVAALPGLFVNAGFGSAGLTMAPLAGAALADLILTGSCEVDLAPFAPPPGAND